MASDSGLVRHDEDVAEAGELRGYRCVVSVSKQNVLVFFLHKLVARRNNHFDYVSASGKLWLAVGSGSADGREAVSARSRSGNRIAAHNARELIHAVIGSGSS